MKSFFSSAIILSVCASTLVARAQNTPAELPKNCSAYESTPLPAEAQIPTPESSPDCASYRSYRGIGRPRNPGEARNCAWQERAARQAKLRPNPKASMSWVIGGSLILANIYINGDGVQRNIPLAMRFACEFEESTATNALPEVAKLNNSTPASKPFEFCDYADTTFTGNFCSSYKSEIAEDHRDHFYTFIKSSMTPDQRAAFEKLIAASNEYISEHAFEVDQGGTIRTMRTIGSQNILNDLFRAEIVHFESKKWPALPENQIKSADDSLQQEFQSKVQELGKQTQEQIQEGAISADNLAKVEKIWENYRDAWFAFAQLRYAAAAQQIRAQITIDRYRLLKTIRSYQD